MCTGPKKTPKEKTPSLTKSVSRRASQKDKQPSIASVKPPPTAPVSSGMTSTAKQPASTSQKPDQMPEPATKKSSIMKKSTLIKNAVEPATPGSGKNLPSSPVWKEPPPPPTPKPIPVEPPKLMVARRRIDQVREPKDPEYKTLEMDNSDWESAKVMRRVDLEKYDTNRAPSKKEKKEKTSKVASKKESNMASRKASNVSRKTSKVESKESKVSKKEGSRKGKKTGETVSTKEEGPKDDTAD